MRGVTLRLERALLCTAACAPLQFPFLNTNFPSSTPISRNSVVDHGIKQVPIHVHTRRLAKDLNGILY